MSSCETVHYFENERQFWWSVNWQYFYFIPVWFCAYNRIHGGIAYAHPHLVLRNRKKKFISRFFKVLFLQVDKLETVILMHFYFVVSLYFVILFTFFQYLHIKKKCWSFLKRRHFPVVRHSISLVVRHLFCNAKRWLYCLISCVHGHTFRCFGFWTHQDLL